MKLSENGLVPKHTLIKDQDGNEEVASTDLLHACVSCWEEKGGLKVDMTR